MEWMIYTIIGVLIGILALIGALMAATSTRGREDRLNEWMKEGMRVKPAQKYSGPERDESGEYSYDYDYSKY